MEMTYCCKKTAPRALKSPPDLTSPAKPARSALNISKLAKKILLFSVVENWAVIQDKTV
jgi:hypothetical protein